MSDKRIRQDIELLRLLSAFGVIWIHTGGPRSGLGYASMLVFVLISTFLIGEPRGAFPESVWKRAKRIGIPFLGWSLIYAAWATLSGGSPLDLSHGWVLGLLASPGFHLWYLPFIFFSIVALDAANRTPFRQPLTLLAGVVAGLLLFSGPLWYPGTTGLATPLPKYLHALPAVFMGYFFSGFANQSRRWSLPILAFMLLGAISARNVPAFGRPYLVAIIIFQPILWKLVGRRLDTWPILSLSTCAFGIYLIHPILAPVVSLITPGPSAAYSLLTFVLSFGIIYAVRRFAPRIAALMT